MKDPCLQYKRKEALSGDVFVLQMHEALIVDTMKVPVIEECESKMFV